jgi:hypothetical protein
VSGYEASCPSCGAEIVFRLGASLLKVCDHCGSAVARKGAALADYGRVAELIPTPSFLRLGVEGGYEGAPRFTLVGRLQLRWARGTWDEWLLGFSDGNWAWLSESQGKLHYMGQVPLPPVPSFGALQVGQTLDLGAPGTFVVTEVRTAAFATAQGELPFDVEPGSELHYADLSGPRNQLATLDYGAGGGEAEALYVGREVTAPEMGLEGLPSEEERRARARAQSLSCPQCGGPLEIRAPDQTQRIGCPYCGSLLDATRDLAVLQALARVPVKPVIPLGTVGQLEGGAWTAIGFVERSVTIEDVRYPWHEYLLYGEDRGFRWLVESSGHWSFVEPVNAADVKIYGAGQQRFRDRTFKHFQSARARVDHVVGEFYWAVAQGDTTETADYVSPPHMLSMEKDASEVTWSFGTYLEPAKVRDAFGLPALPREPVGVGACQPWPLAQGARTTYAWTPLALAAIVLVFLGFAITGGRAVHTESFAIPQTAVPASPEAAVFTQRFFVERSGNLEVRVDAPVDNSWLYLDGALINEETGEVDEFDAEVEYYHGTDSDGSWSEGGTAAYRYVSAVPPGRYVLRLGPQWEPGKNPGSFSVRVRSRVPRIYQALLAGLAVCAWPLLVAWRHVRFESRRWAESDHPMFESE